MILSIASPQSVHLVGHIAQMPTALDPVLYFSEILHLMKRHALMRAHLARHSDSIFL